ncbi:uncharacterized protein LOC143243787 [Tachypleus tridentatus]|uniref:uncharacterized protein LOC143243787 n=1 Tax=Tachypleus tridentatus TaxID=6853 RepID=UPI003FD50BE4
MSGTYSFLGTWVSLWLVCSTHQLSEHTYMLACADHELFVKLPPLQFSCSTRRVGGYYADIESSCHVFHFCAPDYKGGVVDHVFCCHPDLAFNQKFLVCDRRDAVDCWRSSHYFNLQFRGQRTLEGVTTTTTDSYQSGLTQSSVILATESLTLLETGYLLLDETIKTSQSNLGNTSIPSITLTALPPTKNPEEPVLPVTVDLS